MTIPKDDSTSTIHDFDLIGDTWLDASLRATATLAFLKPLRLAILRPEP